MAMGRMAGRGGRTGPGARETLRRLGCGGVPHHARGRRSWVGRSDRARGGAEAGVRDARCVCGVRERRVFVLVA